MPSLRRFLSRKFDPLSDAAERMERARQARDEIGDPLFDSPLGVVPLRRPGGRWMWAYLGGALVIGAIVTTTQTGNSRLPANCHATVVKLSTTRPGLQSPVSWTATGPDGDYALTVDVTAVSRVGVRELSVAAPTTGETYLGKQFRMGGCKAAGRFVLDLTPGEHTLRMFRFGATGAEAVAEQRITVLR